ncbi:5581_t:CDS:1, partial [Gigaspora rosea]
EYFTEDFDKEIKVTNWIYYTEWEGGEEVCKEEISDTKYCEENKELTHSPMEKERLQAVLIQVAWELWQE